MAKICKFPQRVEQLANSKGADISADINGRFRVTQKGTRAFLGTFDNEADLRGFLGGMGREVARDLDGGLPTKTFGEASSASRTKFQDELTPARRVVKLAQVGPGAFLSPIKSISQAMESLGTGQAFSKVYDPTQRAMTKVGNLLAQTKRAGLENKTYMKALRDLEERTLSIKDPEQLRLITLVDEAFTKAELARPGVMLKEGMDVLNTGMADKLTSLGQADSIPLYIRLNKVIDSLLKNREKTLRDVQRMENNILEGRLTPEAGPFLARLRETAGDETTWQEVMQKMALTKEESDSIILVRSMMGDQRYNIPAVFRYSTAPKAEAGFQSGRQQFAVQRGMSAEAVSIANQRARILDDAFSEAGVDRRQVLGAQLPVFRQFIDAGLPVGKESLLNQFPEGVSVLRRRVLSGHLNPYELNPHVTAFKHVRNMIMREEFDPVLRDAVLEIEGIAAVDERSGRLLANYLHELEGLPSESFQKITSAVRTMGRRMGIKVHDRLAEQVVNTLGKLSYQASIPFRPGLVMRNYLQTLFFTAPVVGPKAWLHGLEFATSPKTMKEAFVQARKAGAIDANVVPLFGGTEIFGVETARVAGRFGPTIQKAGFKMEALFDAGFSVYRSADDWGRAVAFHAGRKRVNIHLGTYMRSGRKEADLEAFKRAAKVKTFDETIEAEFESLVRQDRFIDAENLIGKQLSDKTHLLYGNANRPAGWGGVGGRLLGQFGTFPVQYLDYVIESLGRGTVKDRAEWAAVHSAINAGVIVAGAEVLGADLTSWATMPSVTYTGGPYADAMINVAQAISGSDIERNLARRNLGMMFPTMDHPSSIFIPGSYFIADLQDAFQADTPERIFGEVIGIRFLKAGEENSVKKMFGWVFD